MLNKLFGVVQTIFKYTVWGGGGIVVTALILLLTFQEKLIYVPVIPGAAREYGATPKEYAMDYEDVWLTASDGVRLHAWFIKHRSRQGVMVDGPTVLFFQENAGNIAHRLESLTILIDQLRCNVFILSYRGYGASSGSPTQKGIIKDAQAALDHLLQRTDINTKRLVIFGRSLGGAVGAQIVYANPGKVSALLLENTFTSILDMAGKVMPWLRFLVSSSEVRPLNVFVRSPWSTIHVIGKIKTPMLFLSGERDELVPPSHMRRLYAAAVSNPHIQFISFPRGRHMDTWLRGGEAYWTAVRKFLDTYAGPVPFRLTPEGAEEEIKQS